MIGAASFAAQAQVAQAISGSLEALRAAHLNRDAIEQLFSDLKDDPHADLKSVVIVSKDHLVAEAYYNGDTPETLHDLRSAGKSITAILTGIALDRNLIRSVDDSIVDYFPDEQQSRKKDIRIRDLLNMRSGLAADEYDPASPGNEDRLDESPDWVSFAFGLPMKSAPGTTYAYASVNAFLAGAMVENVSKTRLDRFAAQFLFHPLDITRFEWKHAPHNRGVGQGNLSLRARDAAKIGQLFLDEGQYKGQRVVSPAWVRASLAPQVPIASVDRYADAYGYLWYSKTETVGGHPVLVNFASGNGGNKIYLVPQYDMVIVVASSAYGKGYGQKRSQDILLKILAAVDMP